MAARSNFARRWFVSGRVQGVGFRYFVQQEARNLKLSGWAKNLPDGRVEVYAVGAAECLSDLAAALHKGPPMSHVRAVEEQEAAVDGCLDFQVL
jgi:acylphosphatase